MQPKTPPRAEKSRIVLLLALLLSIPFTFIAIHYCLEFGKLRHDVTYDDVNYYVYGLHLYRSYFHNGFFGLWQCFTEITPRAFYSSFAAALGFTIFGVNDWSPMAVNIVVLVSLILFAYFLVRECEWWVQAAAMLYVFASPLAMVAVVECRPDILAAVFLCAAPTYLFFINNSVPRKRDFLIAGSLLGASFMAKSTIFPLIGVVGVITLVFGLMLRIIAQQNGNALKGLWPCIALFAGSALLVASPQLYNASSEMVRYFARAILGKEKEVWTIAGDMNFLLLYYIKGDGANYIQSHLYISYALGVVGLIYIFYFHPPTRLRLACTAWIVVGLVNYAILTLAGAKSKFLGMPFILYVFMFPVLALYFLSLSKSFWVRYLLLPLCTILLASSALFLKPTRPIESSSWMVANDGPRQKKIHQELLRIITSDFPKESGTRSIYLQTTGFLNFDTLQWLAYRDYLPFSTIVGASSMITLEEMKTEARRYDYIIAAEALTIGTYTWYPSNKLGPELVAAFDKAPDMVRIGSVPSLNGAHYVVYRNLAVTNRKFAGWSKVDNVIVYDKAQYLIAVALKADFTLRNEPMEDATLIVDMSCKAKKPVTVQIMLDERKVGEHTFTQYNERMIKTLSLGPVKGGEILRFQCPEGDYDTSADGKIFSMAFEDVRILPTPKPAVPIPAPSVESAPR